MTDFTRTKMAFVIGLLAALFMLKPLVDEFPGDQALVLLGVQLPIRYVYYLFSGLLGLAAYFYGMELVSSGGSRLPQRLGNGAYALAMLVPPVYLGIAAIMAAVYGLRVAFGPSAPAVRMVEIALTALFALAWLVLFVFIRRRLRDQDSRSTLGRMSGEQVEQMAKANGLLEAGLYDLAPIEAFRAVELALRRRLMAEGLVLHRPGIGKLLDLAQERGVLDAASRGVIQDLRLLRNGLIHENQHAGRDEAEDAVDRSRRVISALERGAADAAP